MNKMVYRDGYFVNQQTYNNDVKLLFRCKTKYLVEKKTALKNCSQLLKNHLINFLVLLIKKKDIVDSHLKNNIIIITKKRLNSLIK